MTASEQSQAAAQAWCRDRGLTPNRDTALFIGAQLQWVEVHLAADPVDREGAEVRRDRLRLEFLMLGHALGWGGHD